MANEIDQVLDELKNQGFGIERSGGTHYKIRAADPTKPLTMLARSTEPRALANTLRDLRKIGFIWPPPPKPKRDAGGVSSKKEACCTECYNGDVCLDPKCECHAAEPTRPVMMLLPPSPIEPPTDIDSLHLALVAARQNLKNAREFVGVAADALSKAQSDHAHALDEENAARVAFAEAKKRYDEAIDA